MFGYVRIRRDDLKVKDFNTYRRKYCGICKQLGKDYGFVYRAITSYDIVFLALSLENFEEATKPVKFRCPMNPLKKININISEYVMEYAALINYHLAILKLQDDVIDEKSLLKKLALKLFMCNPRYKNIKNKPQINGVELDGNKTLEELGIQGAEEGKGLSTNDFDDTYKKKLDGLSNYDDTKIKQEISSLADSLAETDKSLTETDKKVAENEGKITETNKTIEELTETVSNNTGSIETINKNIETINTKNTEQDTAINTNKTDIKALKTDNTKNKQDIKALQDRSTEIETDISTIETDIADIQEDITAIQNKDVEQDNKITENTDALTKANTKIAELEAIVALQDEQIPRRGRRRREHYINR